LSPGAEGTPPKELTGQDELAQARELLQTLPKLRQLTRRSSAGGYPKSSRGR
jgi:hypothetical protein